MKKMKKILAMLLAFTMVLGMSMTTMAANLVKSEPSNEDTGVVTIQGVEENPTVTLYQIARADYDSSDNAGLIGYVWADHKDDDPEVYTTNLFEDTTQPTATEITTVANDILANPQVLVPFATITDTDKESSEDGMLSGTTYTCTVAPGAYIAILTGASDGAVYNPIFLTVSYNANGTITEGTVDLNEDGNYYLYGTEAVAKKSEASLEKSITAGTTKDSEKDTVTVGDFVEYKLDIKVPSYPANAANKTFFVSDSMTEGLSFKYSSLKLNFIEGSAETGEVSMDSTGQFKLADEKLLATATKTENGFNIVFNYDELITDATTGAAYTDIKVTYGAYVNAKAVVGIDGNPNTATLYYTNTPNQGSTHTTTEVPTGNGIESDSDTETVYTYQLSFHKKGEGEDAGKLAGAVFGIYSNQDCTQLIEKVTTNENGYGVSTKVEAGTYYIKELVAPAGYSLNTEKFQINATWATATTTNTATDTVITYTSEANGPQVGWLDGEDIFHEMYEFEAAVEGEVWPAYIESTTSKSTTSKDTLVNEGDGGTVLLGTSISNTKIIALPSTGGIGTTIFTVAGCGIMIAAAFFFFASRKKEN